MGNFVMVQGGGEGIFLTPDFADAVEAQAFADSVSIGGVVTQSAVFLATPAQLGERLETSRAQLQRELEAEGDRRSQLVDIHFQSVNTGFVLGVAVNALSALGSSWNAVAVAWDDARQVVDLLPNEAAIAAYDVVTDPAWP